MGFELTFSVFERHEITFLKPRKQYIDIIIIIIIIIITITIIIISTMFMFYDYIYLSCFTGGRNS